MNKKGNDVQGQNWWNELTEHEFQTSFRMSNKVFIELQAELDDLDLKTNNDIDNKLLASLWILGNTLPLENVNELFNIEEDICEIIKESYEKILKLATTYIRWPDFNEAELIENNFLAKYNFQGILGVVGSLYIDLSTDLEDKLYFNEITEKYCMVLQIVCDDKLLLRDVCIGCPGGYSVEKILECSPLYNKLIDECGYLRKYCKYLLGGTEHPRLNTLLTPYKLSDDLTGSQKKFNILHESVMAVTEQTLKCIQSRFPRLMNVDMFPQDIANLLVGAICVLHNFLSVRNDCTHILT